MPGRNSSLWPLDKAMSVAIENDSATAALLAVFDGKPAIFSGAAPKETGYDRIVIGDSTEDGRGVFNKKGNEVYTQFHIYSKIIGRAPVLEIYNNLLRLFDGVELTLDGHTLYRAKMKLLTVLRDPVDPVMHGVVEYSAWTTEGA